jgi:uncharacterized protein (TIGR03067 family)
VQFALVLTVACGAPALKDPPPRVPDIVGKWEIESRTVGGVTLPPYGPGSLWYTFAADGQCVISRGSDIPPSQMSFTIDARASPPTFTLRPKGGHQEGLSGIYKVESDTLTLCFDRDRRNATPGVFESPKGSQVVLYTFRRVKADD